MRVSSAHEVEESFFSAAPLQVAGRRSVASSPGTLLVPEGFKYPKFYFEMLAGICQRIGICFSKDLPGDIRPLIPLVWIV